jgi:hypothetical protein
MENSHVFDYDQPTPDTLAGIYVEASDDPLEEAARVASGAAGQTEPGSAALFGVTLTVDDCANANPSNAQPSINR